VGPRPDFGEGNGVDVAAWPLISEQVLAGVDVTLAVLGPANWREAGEAERRRVALVEDEARRWTLSRRNVDRFLTACRPDLVHIHSVFLPAHAALAAGCRRARIPYVVSPHGGLNLFRGKAKKAVYGVTVEKPFLRRAAAVFVLTPRERDTIDGWLGHSQVRYVVTPNPLRPPAPDSPSWSPSPQPTLVYVGRYDVIKKGLDRLVEIARQLPHLRVDAYGAAAGTEQRGFASLMDNGLPENMTFHPPVFADEKQRILSAATMYVQLARNEGFGMSIVEAMSLGVPVGVAEDCDIAPMITDGGLGLVLTGQPSQAARELRAAVADPNRLAAWSAKGREWSQQELAPARLAAAALAAYESIV
jgi:glycosyltransferase involved in cell wall biosynthesis